MATKQKPKSDYEAAHDAELRKHGLTMDTYKQLQEEIMKIPDVNAVGWGIINFREAQKTATEVKNPQGVTVAYKFDDRFIGITVGLIRENESSRKRIDEILKPLGVNYGVEVWGAIRAAGVNAREE